MGKGVEGGWKRFLELCLKAKGEKELEGLFQAILTPTERQEIASRARIFQELLRGERTQREIAKDLSVGLANVTRGSNVLKTLSEELKEFLKK